MAILTTKEVAKIFDVTVQTISNYRKLGMPYRGYTVERGYLYDLSAIIWIIIYKRRWRTGAIDIRLRMIWNKVINRNW
jgi:DNA-binding transcriptional MerR regulator